jgi:hypothetical protein
VRRNKAIKFLPAAYNQKSRYFSYSGMIGLVSALRESFDSSSHLNTVDPTPGELFQFA